MPTSLQGLNIVYPPPPPSDDSPQDLLALPPGFPDLSAQLDLWTNLSFASDEPFIPMERKEPDFLSEFDQSYRSGDQAKDHSENPDAPIIAGTVKPAQSTVDNTMHAIPPSNGQSSFDLRAFLAGLGIDPFIVPPQTQPPPLSPTVPSVPSIASPSSAYENSHIPSELDSQPLNKRTRTRRGSTASQTPTVAPTTLHQRAISSDTRSTLEISDDHDPLTTPLTAAEDKRRRNTAASARFRAKKKEREQALERRSKELETKVTELERECEGLRRENGWLKGLVVGVTGGNHSGVPAVPTDNSASGDNNESNKGKRKHDSVESSTKSSDAQL